MTEAAELIQIVEFLESESNHLEEFITEVNDRFSTEQRSHLYQLLKDIG